MTAVPTVDDPAPNPLTLVMVIRSPDDHRTPQAELMHRQSLPGGRTVLTDLPPSGHDAGRGYCFVPILTGLRYIATL